MSHLANPIKFDLAVSITKNNEPIYYSLKHIKKEDTLMASILLGILGAIIALGTMVYLSIRIQKPLQGYVTENVSDKAASITVLLTWLIIYYSGLKAAASILLSGVERGGGRLYWNVICDVIAAPATVIGNVFQTIQGEWLFLIAGVIIALGSVYRKIKGGGGVGRGRK